MSLSTTISGLWKKFQDREYRQAYVESLLDSALATQIHALREQRHLTQAQLAALTGMKQPRVSALENVNYSSWSINTLKRLARAFDVALTVRFESFGAAIERAGKLSVDDLKAPPFEDEFTDLVLRAATATVTEAFSLSVVSTNQTSSTSGESYVARITESVGSVATNNEVGGARILPFARAQGQAVAA